MLINVNQTKAPDRGIYIKGLKLIGANWDYSRGILTDNHPYESINVIPCVSFIYIYLYLFIYLFIFLFIYLFIY